MHETELFFAQHLARGSQPARPADGRLHVPQPAPGETLRHPRTSTARSSGACALTDPNRRGLLGQGSILTVTSYPNRTSVVQRGKWILENLLGTPPPPPPPMCRS